MKAPSKSTPFDSVFSQPALKHREPDARGRIGAQLKSKRDQSDVKRRGRICTITSHHILSHHIPSKCLQKSFLPYPAKTFQATIFYNHPVKGITTMQSSSSILSVLLLITVLSNAVMAFQQIIGHASRPTLADPTGLSQYGHIAGQIYL